MGLMVVILMIEVEVGYIIRRITDNNTYTIPYTTQALPAVLRQQHQGNIRDMSCLVFADILHMNDPTFIDKILSFTGYVCGWILSIIDSAGIGLVRYGMLWYVLSLLFL